MGAVQQFNLPDPGEGLTEAEIVTWRVKVGDVVRVNDVVVEVETAKSLVELPVPFAGTVSELLVAEGDTVDVGTPIIAVETGSLAAPAPAEPSDASLVGRPAVAGQPQTEPDAALSPEGAVEPGMIGGPAPGGRTSVLVGYGPRESQARRRPRRVPPAATEPAAAPVPVDRAAVPPVPAAPPAAAEGAPAERAPAEPASTRVLAKPPVRKYAKDLGVDIAAVTPGPGGIVTRVDVDAYRVARLAPVSEPVTVPVGESALAPEQAGAVRRETRIPVRGVRKATAAAMVGSAFTAPHVTMFHTVDVTRTMRLVRRLREDPELAGVKVSPLLLVARAVLVAVRRNPGINASWDEAAGEIVLKHYVNLGIAAATPRGLIVPNIKDAHALRLRDLAEALGELVATAREGRTQPAQLSGGTFTITNVGVFGIDTGTPILNPGEAGILAFGAVRDLPWVVRGRVRPRSVTTLAASFDHRLVDGELGSRFLADVAAVLERPDRALVWA